MNVYDFDGTIFPTDCSIGFCLWCMKRHPKLWFTFFPKAIRNVILRKMGKRYNPSDANIMLYSKWVNEWHFSKEAIEAVCDKTGKSDPSLALVDSILEQIHNSAAEEKTEILDRAAIEQYEQQRDQLREVLAEMGQFTSVTPARQKLYADMLKLYPQEIILMAARECAAKHSTFESVMKLLESWHERGFTAEEQIAEHIRTFHEKEDFFRSLREKWNSKDQEPGTKGLQLLDKWENELAFSREMIMLAADMSFEAKKPMAYMDKLLTEWASNNIRTPGQVMELRNKKKAQPQDRNFQKSVNAQQYSQRDYSGEQEEAMRRMLEMIGDDGHA